ncbi:PREDICTED: death-associated inhibitor of apoptosis 1-like [Camelina sativa]|uniref:Death-associated inhibitor of apoptosis 1-like n=1 Tax=Camelina sativa TaxID=90675 RepID=A0ABM0TRT3_CAMSA|nr:PREDICTED: death-associated inhibitor of apoptosis 1-like [Camelina sativa]
MSQLGDLLRDSEDGGTRSERTTMMLSLLQDNDHQTDGGDRTMSKWSILKQRLRFDWVACCGKPLTLRFRQSETPLVDEEEEEESQRRVVDFSDPGSGTGSELGCLQRGATTRNLAEALAEERLAHVTAETSVVAAKVPLMRLLAESDGCDSTISTAWMGCDPVCCVCMGREKGAAFIPCGHTYCRVCSREIWANRGTCPLCNRSIFDVLDLY